MTHFRCKFVVFCLLEKTGASSVYGKQVKTPAMRNCSFFFSLSLFLQVCFQLSRVGVAETVSIFKSTTDTKIGGRARGSDITLSVQPEGVQVINKNGKDNQKSRWGRKREKRAFKFTVHKSKISTQRKFDSYFRA